jgi:hypothetical protein
LPAENPSPGAGVTNWISASYPGTPGSRPCDSSVTDQYWAHTFNNLTVSGFQIQSATLDIRVNNRNSNDNLLLGFISSGAPTWQFQQNLVTLGVPLSSSGLITINLNAGLLAGIQTNGSLDVAVQDDSAVDCATLTITYIP